MNHSVQNLVTGFRRLVDAICYASGIQPVLFATLVLLRSLTRVLHFLASVLPFKILLVLGTGYSLPALLEPYFKSKETLAYSLCLAIGIFVIGAKLCEHLIDVIKRQKAKTFLGDSYTTKTKRRDNLVSIISKATEASSAIFIATVSILLLLFLQHKTGIATILSSMLCFTVIIFSQGDFRNYIISSPLNYVGKCITAVTFVAFMVLVYTSLNASAPPVFLSLVVCLILIRQFCQSIEQTVAVTLSLKDEEERIARIFVGLI